MRGNAVKTSLSTASHGLETRRVKGNTVRNLEIPSSQGVARLVEGGISAAC
jgi:hypothetical protein